VGFEPTIAVLELAKTVRALDRSATAIGIFKNDTNNLYLAIHIDDGIIIGENERQIEKTLVKL
jgi:hypothetical protein